MPAWCRPHPAMRLHRATRARRMGAACTHHLSHATNEGDSAHPPPGRHRARGATTTRRAGRGGAWCSDDFKTAVTVHGTRYFTIPRY